MDERIRRRRATVRLAARRRMRRQIASAVALAVIAVAAVALARSPLFAIDSVRIDGVDGKLAQEVRSVAAVPEGRNLLEANLAAAERRVAALPWVATASVEQEPPSTVVIEVTQREAAATLRTARAAWLLDADGRLIAGGSREETPQVVVPDLSLPPVGQPVEDEGVVAALDTIAQLDPSLAGRAVRYTTDGDQVTAVLDVADVLSGQDELKVVLGSPQRLEDKAVVTASMLDVIAGHQAGGGDGDDAEAAAPDEAEGAPAVPAGPVVLDVRAPEHPVLRPASGG